MSPSTVPTPSFSNSEQPAPKARRRPLKRTTDKAKPKATKTPAAQMPGQANPSAPPVLAPSRAPRVEHKLNAAIAALGGDVSSEAGVSKPEPKVRKGRERDLLDGRAEYKLVPINDIHSDPDQPRKIFRNIEALASNLEQVGLNQPVTVRIDADNKLILMYGERRWRAAMLAKWTHIPAIIRYGVKDSSILAQQLSENVHREDMDPMEEAWGLRRYMRENKIATYLQASQALGYSLTWVTNRAALLDLEPEDQEKVAARELPITKAVAKSRAASGTTRQRPERKAVASATAASSGGGHAHFSDEHPLAGRARSRCRTGNEVDHKPKVGGVACGACWELVIRLDARRNPNTLSATG